MPTDIEWKVQEGILKAVSYGHGLDKKAIRHVQKRMKGNDATLLKYMRAQAVLAEYLWEQMEDFGTGIKLMTLCHSQTDLYKLMSKIGFVWSSRNNLWRLDKRLKAPRNVQL